MDVRELTQEAALAMQNDEFDLAIELLKASLGRSRQNLAADANGPILQPREDSSSVMECASVLSPRELAA
eukprot:scaffold7175_cov76-Amphora_coffeaeformis.AAC.1